MYYKNTISTICVLTTKTQKPIDIIKLFSLVFTSYLMFLSLLFAYFVKTINDMVQIREPKKGQPRYSV